MARFGRFRRSFGRGRTIIKKVRSTNTTAFKKLKKKNMLMLGAVAVAGGLAFHYKDQILAKLKK